MTCGCADACCSLAVSLARDDASCLLRCRLHVVVAGRPQPGQPPRRLLLFVHGFPEGHFSWRHQLTVGALANLVKSARFWGFSTAGQHSQVSLSATAGSASAKASGRPTCLRLPTLMDLTVRPHVRRSFRRSMKLQRWTCGAMVPAPNRGCGCSRESQNQAAVMFAMRLASTDTRAALRPCR